MYEPKQPSQSRIPVTGLKTNDNQHATGSFKVPPPIIDNSQAPPEIQKYSSEKVDIITAKLAAKVAEAANTQAETAPQGEVPELGLVQRMLQNSAPSRSSIQTKLSVGEPGDKYEQEADSMARSVMSMPDSALQKQTSLGERIQQKVQAQLMKRPSNELPNLTPLGERIQQKVQAQLMKRPTNEPPNLTPLGERIQQKVQAQLMQRASDRSIEAGGNIESRLNSQGGGNPLSEQVRAYMEPRFGTDFSQVRVHTGESAVQMNQELGAQAFTHGSNIYYGAGKAPGVDELTAHELTHVVQQTGAFAPVSVQRQTKPSAAASLPLKFSSASFNPATGGAIIVNTTSQNATIQSAPYAPSGIAKVSGGTNAQAQDWEAGFIQTLRVSNRTAKYIGSPKQTKMTISVTTPARDAFVTSGAPWYDPNNGSGTGGQLAFSQTNSTVNVQMIDQPTWGVPWNTPDGNGKLKNTSGKDIFTSWMIVRQKTAPNKIQYLNWISWEVDYGAIFDYASKNTKTVNKVTGNTKVTGSGSGKGSHTPVLTGSIPNNTAKPIWL